MGSLYSGRNLGLFLGKEAAFGQDAELAVQIKQTGFSGGFKPEYVESASRMGSRALAGNIKVTGAGSLTVPFEADPDNLGWMLKAVLGQEVVTAIGGGAYKHTFSMLNGSVLPSFAAQGQYGGWKALRFLGLVGNSLSLEISPKAIVSGSFETVFSEEKDVSLSITEVDSDTETFTSAGHGLADGDTIKFLPGQDLPAELNEDTVYFIKNSTVDSFKLSLTEGGAAIDLSDEGTVPLTIQLWSILEPTSLQPFVFNDGQIKVGGSLFGEVKSGSVQFSNNLIQDDYRLNFEGRLASIPAGKFEASGKLSVLFNPQGYALRELYLNGTPTTLEFTLDSGVVIGAGTYKVVISFGIAQISSGDPGTDENGMYMDMDFKAFADPASPVTIELHNNRATAY